MQALAEQTYPDFETIVVDNASSDGSVAWLREHWPDVRIVQMDDNVGFPGAVNAGITASRSDYVVLLNNDTKATPDWLNRLIGAMEEAPDYGWGSSKLLRFDQPEVIDSAGHVYSVWVGAARQIGEGEPATEYTRPRRIFGATASASVYRRQVFDDIGLFDDTFFLIHEDTDVDLRANMAGYRCLYVPDAVIYHKRGASYEVAREIHLSGVRNRIWATRSLPIGVLFLWIVTKGLRAFRWIPARLLGRRTSKRATASAWKDVRPKEVLSMTLHALRTLPGKRREVAATRRLNSIQFLRVLWECRPSARSDAASQPR